jgi:hypothetical protein
MLSQDSIFFRNGAIVRAKILEVNSQQVRYYNFDNALGPKYTVNKNTIVFIKYFDNYVDSFSVAISEPQRSTYPKLEIKHSLVYCYGEQINDATLLQLLEGVKDTVARNKLIDEFDDMKLYQRKYFTHSLAGAGFFGVSAFYGLIYGGLLHSPELFIAFTGVGVAVLIPAMISSIKNKNKYLMQMRVLVKNYNELK